MIPLLFPPTESAFTTHGIGPVPDAVNCTVREELNGRYELTLELPASSRHFAEIEPRTLVLAKPNPYDRAQPFRIYREGKKINRLVSEYAQHISYDLDGIPVGAFTATSAADAVAKIKSRSIAANGYTFGTNIVKSAEMKVTVPTACRSLIGDDKVSLLASYGGELYFDRYSVQLLQARGADRGVVIAYGKNLTDLTQEKNIAEMYTGVLPYWTGGDGDMIRGAVQYAPGSWNYTRIKSVDLSSEFDGKPSEAQLNTAGQRYIAREKIGQPKVSLKVSFVPPGSLGLHALEDLRLGDTVTVRYEQLGIEVKSTVTAYTWDVLRERYVSVEIGERESAAKALTDAGRLIHGDLSADRLAKNSIGGGGGGKIKHESLTVADLAPNSVTVNKIVNGAVETVKIKDGAVTGNKVLDKAIRRAKLGNDVEVLFADILAANEIFAGVITASGHVEAGYFSVAGREYRPGILTVDGTVYHILKA